MLKYKDINNIFNIVDMYDDYVVCLNRKNIEYLYIYEIVDTNIYEITPEVISEVRKMFKEFLKEVGFDFKFVIKNEKMDVQKYLKRLEKNIRKEIIGTALCSEFFKDLKEKIESEEIYEKKSYFIVNLPKNTDDVVNNVDNLVGKFEKVGCKIRKIDKKEELRKILYESINKGVKNEF